MKDEVPLTVLSKIISDQSLKKDGKKVNISDDLNQSYLKQAKSQMQHAGMSLKLRVRASTQMRQYTSLGTTMPRTRKMLFEINTDH